MKHITFTAEELKENAIKAMENCLAYLSIGNNRMAAINYWAASTWEEMLNDLDIFLDEDDEHYSNMIEIWAEQTKSW